MKRELTIGLAIAAALTAAPLEAQGNGKNKGNGNGKAKGERVENVRTLRDTRSSDRVYRDEDRARRDRDGERVYRDGRWEDVRLERRNGKRVPPGWCKGKGNPHNTVENCGYGANRNDRRGDDRRDDDRVYDRRRDDRVYDRRDGRNGSYSEAHAAFHRDHDRVCRARAAERPLDVTHQLRVRSECRADHQEWHARTGTSH